MPEHSRETFFTSQPGKAIWSTLHLAVNAARLPFWILYFIPKALRQDRRYTWRKALGIRIFRAVLAWGSHVEMKTPTLLTPGNEKDQWVTLNPTNSKYYTGVTKIDPEIEPVTIGGTWYPARPSTAQKSGKIALHFHGGAYVVGDGRKKDTEFFCNNLLKNTGVSHVFSCQYRLSSNPGGRFPAALQDAITAYTYLLSELNISPTDIVVTGDSAGGNLTLCLLRYIADHGSQLNLPSPLCAWLWSPWVDPAGSIRDSEAFDKNTNAPTDYLNSAFGLWGAECYVPAKSTGVTGDSEYINFLANPFKTETPLYFSICENEVLFDDDTKTYQAFSKIQGNKTEVAIEEASPHDIILVGGQIGFHKEAAEAARKAGKYLSSL